VADINVERKEGSVWPWIIGLVVLALLIWLLWSWMGDRDRTDDTVIPADTIRTDSPFVGTTPPPVTDTVPLSTVPADTFGAGTVPGDTFGVDTIT
jgi:hypothetical protein